MKKETNKEHQAGLWEYLFPHPESSMAEGYLSAKFESVQDVGDWVSNQDRDAIIRLKAVLAQDKLDSLSRKLGTLWLDDHMRSLEADYRNEQLKNTVKAAFAAKESARWAMIASIISAVGVVSGVVFSLYEVNKPKDQIPPIKVEIFTNESPSSSRLFSEENK